MNKKTTNLSSLTVSTMSKENINMNCCCYCRRYFYRIHTIRERHKAICNEKLTKFTELLNAMMILMTIEKNNVSRNKRSNRERERINKHKTYNRILLMIYKHSTRDPHSSKLRLTLSQRREPNRKKCVLCSVHKKK